MENDIEYFLGKSVEYFFQSNFTDQSLDRWKEEVIDDRIYVELVQSGLSIEATKDRNVIAIHLYSDGYKGYAMYPHSLPGGLVFSDSRESARNKLGIPNSSGGGKVVAVLGKSPFWDRFDRDLYSITVRYIKHGDSILLVTLFRSDTASS